MIVPQSYGVCTACAWKQYDYFVEANFRALSSFHTSHVHVRINSVIIIFYCMKCFPWAWHTISPCHQRWVHYSPVGSVFVLSHLLFDEIVQCSTDKWHTPAPNFDYLLPSNHRHFIIHGSPPSYFYGNDKELAEWSLATLIQFYRCFNDGMMKYKYLYAN